MASGFGTGCDADALELVSCSFRAAEKSDRGVSYPPAAVLFFTTFSWILVHFARRRSGEPSAAASLTENSDFNGAKEELSSNRPFRCL